MFNIIKLNEKDNIIDIIPIDTQIIIVSKHYLGSINHTLLSYEALKKRNAFYCSHTFSLLTFLPVIIFLIQSK